MNPLIFVVALKDARTLLAALAFGMAALQLLIGSTYQAFGEVTSEVMQQMPRELAALMKMQPGAPLGADPNAYVSLGWSHPLFLVLGCAVAITLGAGSLAGEIDRGTILYLLARPIPRWSLVVTRALILVPTTGVVAAAALAGTGLAGWVLGTGVEAERFGLVAANAWALFLGIGAVALLASALSRTAGQAGGIAIAFTLVSFFVDFLADLWEPVRRLEPISVFTHYSPSEVLATRTLPLGDVAVLCGLAITATVLAALIFSRRDIS